jgi:hypothetical protein
VESDVVDRAHALGRLLTGPVEARRSAKILRYMIHSQGLLHLGAPLDEVLSQIEFQYTVHIYLQNNKKTVSRSDGPRFQEIWITLESRLHDGGPHGKERTAPHGHNEPNGEDAKADSRVHSRGLSHGSNFFHRTAADPVWQLELVAEIYSMPGAFVSII